MKLHHPHIFEKLGFDQILQQLVERVSSEEAQEACLQIRPTSDPDILLPELQRVEEFRQLLIAEESTPYFRIPSVSSLLKKLDVRGNWLSVHELGRMLGWLGTIVEARQYFHKRKELYPTLDTLLNAQPFDKRLVSQINGLLDDHGNLRSDASPKLAQIRKDLNRASNSLRSTLYKLLRRAQEQGWTTESEVMLRNDRLVIPLKAEAKNQMSGFVQDVSQSGGTVFVEPAEALPLNNQIRELQIEEQNEIVRILQVVSDSLRQSLPGLMTFRDTMLSFDLIRAKARLAETLDACLPTVLPKGNITLLRDAYYPLLQLKAKQDKFDVIPVDINLSPENRIMVISGPNAGGKSVSLKTLGLTQMMLQAGMLVPVREDSVFRLYDSLFVDIGDEQSVEADLSTYTSRLFAWRKMGDRMTKKSLFLIDEFGSGTDPKQGGAIAEAFLERFVIQQSYGIITTHYGNLKDYAELTPGIINAAMQFDTKELRPTYRLLDGMPGRSYAFEMAKRVGVHHTVLRRAKRKVGGDELDIEKLRKELEKKSDEMTRLMRENARKQQKLDQLLQRNEKKELYLERDRKSILNEAKQEARSLIEKANRDIERTIREIRETQAEKERTLQLRKQLAATAPTPELLPDLPVEEEEKPQKKKRKKSVLAAVPEPQIVEVRDGSPISVGDWVKLKSGNTVGELVEIQGKKGVIATDALRLNIKLNQVVKIHRPKQRKTKSQPAAIIQVPAAKARLELDLMGKRVEEALPELDRFIDDARVAGLRNVRVLHGKGTGALREAIRQRLNELSFVRGARDAHIEQGGAGWTVVELEG